MKLYSYFRSSASYRVRIALNLKRLAYDYVPIHLLRGGGEQFSSAFRALNPAAAVPVLIDGDTVLTQSLAILEYLEEKYPEPPLLPSELSDRARVRALALTAACEIHPLNNLRVTKYLTGTMGFDEAAKQRWYEHWVDEGLRAMEAMLAGDARTGGVIVTATFRPSPIAVWCRRYSTRCGSIVGSIICPPSCASTKTV